MKRLWSFLKGEGKLASYQLDSVLHTAVEEGNLNKVVELLNKGANPNSCCSNSYSALMLAVRAWKPTSDVRINIVQALLRNGANPLYVSRDGYQALTLAHDLEVVTSLLDANVALTPAIATKLINRFHGSNQVRILLKEKGFEPDWDDSMRQVYHRIDEYKGLSLYTDILEEAIPFLQDTLSQLNIYKKFEESVPIKLNDQYTFYAFSRINDLLLLNFQANAFSPKITLDQYKLFWEKVGFNIYLPKEFHPFICEIGEVEECVDQPVPKLIKCRWPYLMFGDLLFSRASVCVEVSPDHIHKETAEKSTLYWCHRREDRPCDDLSHGWGSNSQWRTRFRFDYWNQDDLLYNVNHVEDEEDVLSDEQLLLLKFRCFIKLPEVLDSFPYNYFAVEKYKIRNC